MSLTDYAPWHIVPTRKHLSANLFKRAIPLQTRVGFSPCIVAFSHIVSETLLASSDVRRALTNHGPPRARFTKPYSHCFQCRRIRVVSHTAIFVIFPSFHFVVNPFFGRTPLSSITVAPFMTIPLPFRGHGILQRIHTQCIA
jgi:hypothetical protein